MAHGTHDYDHDPRNDSILIGINGEQVPRAQATVSVFDSGFMLGDGVWEGIRVHNGKLAFLGDHLRRLAEGAKALDMDIGKSPDELTAMIHDTLEANGMSDASGVHIRLMVTRGVKSTPYQDPRFTITPPTIVIIPEYKEARPETLTTGVRLATVSTRRGRPDVQDPKWNSHSKLNCISACIQAAKAGADEGLMLDPQGFVATCNSTHFFVVRRPDGPGTSERPGPIEVWTSTGDYCMPGITRRNVIRLVQRHGADHGMTVHEKNFSLTEVYGADEAFVTGTFAGIAPVTEVDGRIIGSGARGPIVELLQRQYLALIEEESRS
jgi:branched-chain amino acid aminotransferase